MNIVNGVINYLGAKTLNSQVDKKIKHEALLFQLFGRDEFDLKTYSTPVSRYLLNNHGNTLTGFGYGDFQKISELVQAIQIGALYNVASALYPEEMDQLNEGKPIDQPIAFEAFTFKALRHIFTMIRSELVELDETFYAGAVPEEDLFVPLAENIIDLLFPSSSGFWDDWCIRPLLVKVIPQALCGLYKDYFWKSSYAKDPSALKIDDFAGIIASALDLLCGGIAQKINEEEGSAPGLKEFLSLLASKFSIPLQETIVPIFPLLQTVTQERFHALCSSLLLKGIMNIVQTEEREGALTLEETISFASKSIRNLFFNQFLIVKGKREAGEIVDRDDFDPLARELIFILFSYDPQLVRLSLRRFPQLVVLLSTYLMDFEASLNINGDREPIRGRLRALLEELVQDQMNRPDMQLTKDLSIYLGVEAVVTQLENMCLHIGEAVLSYAEKFIAKVDSYKHLSKLIAPHLEGNASHIRHFLRGLIPSFLGNDVQSEHFKNYFKFQIAGIIFSVITNALEKGAKKHGVENALYYAIQGLLGEFRKDEELRSQGLIHFLFHTEEHQQGLEDYIPLPKPLSTKLAHAISTSFLPKMLWVLRTDSHLWIDQKEELREQLDNDRMAELSRVLGRFVEQFLPYFLSDKSADVAKALLNVISAYLIVPPGDSMQGSLTFDEEELKPHDIWQQWLTNTFHGLGSHRSRNNRVLFRFVKRYTEGFLLMLFIRFKECLQNIQDEENSDAQVHVHAAKTLLDEAQRHFGEINRIKSSLREKRAFKVPREVLTHHFSIGEQLHRVLDISKPQLAVGFYKELSEDLLQVMGLDDTVGLPAPAFLKPIVWELFEDLLLPTIVESLVDQIKSPDAIHHYLLSLLSAVKSSITDADGDIEERMLFEGELQNDLEELSGALLQELLGLQPTVAMPLLRYRKIRERLGSAVGQSIRGALEQFSTLDLVDLLIKSSLPALHPGRWVSRHGVRTYKRKHRNQLPPSDASAERFLPIRVNEEQVEEKGWDFHFPKNREEKREVQEATERRRADLKRTVTVELEEMIHQQADISIQDALHGIWDDIQSAFDAAIKAVFGREGRKLKDRLDHLCHMMWRYVLFPLLKGITYPFRKIASALFKVYYKYQARARVEDVGHPIHQNFFLHSLEKVIHSLAQKSS